VDQMDRADVVIVGGGIIGFSIGYQVLQRSPGLRVLVLEREITPGQGATGKATGGLRHQFSTAVNIGLTQLSMPVYLRFQEEFGVDMGLIQNGYLFVSTQPSAMKTFAENVALQRSLGVPSELLSPDDLTRVLPVMRTDDLLGGSVCWTDGSADPYSALTGFWQGMRRLGGEVRFGCEVTGFEVSAGRVSAVQTNQGAIACGMVVNAAGPWAAVVGQMAGIAIPMQPYKRSVHVARPMPEFSRVMPLTVDMDSGFYVHRENRSGQLMLGGTDKVSEPGFSTAVDFGGLERVVMAGVERFPALERAEVFRSYAGLREITPDFHAIIDRAPGLENFFMACGFSGHGFMHAPAAGLLTAELMLDGAAHSLDIAPLRFDRFQTGKAHEELASF
jgi:sarcosine oxidase, subunit beta